MMWFLFVLYCLVGAGAGLYMESQLYQSEPFRYVRIITVGLTWPVGIGIIITRAALAGKHNDTEKFPNVYDIHR